MMTPVLSRLVSGRCLIVSVMTKTESTILMFLTSRYVFSLILFRKSSLNDYILETNNYFLQIYNETLNDLIEPNNKNLEIRESISKGIYINRLSECNVTTREQVLKYMWQGDDQRIIAETKLNEQSSRSHTVFRINITSRPINGKEIRL